MNLSCSESTSRRLPPLASGSFSGAAVVCVHMCKRGGLRKNAGCHIELFGMDIKALAAAGKRLIFRCVSLSVWSWGAWRPACQQSPWHPNIAVVAASAAAPKTVQLHHTHAR